MFAAKSEFESTTEAKTVEGGDGREGEVFDSEEQLMNALEEFCDGLFGVIFLEAVDIYAGGESVFPPEDNEAGACFAVELFFGGIEDEF